MFELLEPWQAIAEEQRVPLEDELAREVSADHLLAGKSVRAVARRQDCDDVLFEVSGIGYVVVHLTWSQRRETSSHWPKTETFESLVAWIERRMKPHHEGF